MRIQDQQRGPLRIAAQRFAFASLLATGCRASVAESGTSRCVEPRTGRQELYALNPAHSIVRAARGIAAVIPRELIRVNGPNSMKLRAPSVREAEHLCEGEPFAEQPAAAICTAALIDDNLLITAGHCFNNAWDCRNFRFVFDYAYSHAGEPVRLDPSATYDCVRARVQENDLGQTSDIRDYAIIELDRPVRDRPVLRITASLPDGAEDLALISATGGLPLKLDLHARALDLRRPHRDYFILQSETFRGSSGAPVFDASGALLGIFVRGGNDFVQDPSRRCFRWAVRGTGLARVPEQASYAFRALEALCATGYPSAHLCGPP